MKLLIFILLIFSMTVASAALSPAAFAAAPRINEAAPDFELLDLIGSIHRLTDYRGKVVILNFWASWCPDCLAEIPSLSGLYGRMKDQDLVVLGVSIDRSRAALENAAGAISYPVLLDQKGDVFVKKYTIRRLPVTIVIDRDGVIREKIFGKHDFASEQFLEKLKKILSGKTSR